jgi:hypothetical protein
MTTTMMSVEGDFRAMAEAGVDGALRRNLPTFRSETARLLGKMQRQMDSPPVHRDLPCIFSVEVFAQERAGNLRRGAAEFGGDDAVKLREHAATIETLCADTDTFLHKIVSSPYFQRARLLSIHREAAGTLPMDTVFLLLI